MAASIGGAIKTAIEGAGLSLQAHRDEAPKAAVLPYAVIHEGISTVPEPAFNAADDAAGHVSELVQVDLWMQWRHPTTNVMTESFTLPSGLIRALHGFRLAGLSATPKRVFLATVVGAQRRLERKENKVHIAITLKLRRVM